MANSSDGLPAQVTAFSDDVAGGPVTYSITNDTSLGGFAIDLNTGVVTVFDHTKIATPGAYTITVKANDGTLDSPTQDFVINVFDNNAPVAGDNSDTATEDTLLSVDALSGVLANNSDPDAGDSVSVVTGFAVTAEGGLIEISGRRILCLYAAHQFRRRRHRRLHHHRPERLNRHRHVDNSPSRRLPTTTVPMCAPARAIRSPSSWAPPLPATMRIPLCSVTACSVMAASRWYGVLWAATSPARPSRPVDCRKAPHPDRRDRQRRARSERRWLAVDS